MSMDSIQYQPFLQLTNNRNIVNPSTSGVGTTAPIEKTKEPSSVFQACEALSIKDGHSPDVSGSCCGKHLDIGKDGCIDNQAWG